MWKNINGLYIYNQPKFVKQKYAIFDLDNTIIKTKSGKKFPINTKDWEFLFNNTIDKIIELSKEYKIIIITNQKGISTGKINIEDFKKKIVSIKNNLKIEISCFISINDDMYRKPRTLIIDNYLKLDKNSFFCGDAAGRKSTKLLKKDFTDTDYKFALNLGIKFYTPEQLFNKETRKINYTYPIDFNSINYGEYPKIKLNKKTKEVILNCGYPASGKSYFAKKYLVSHGYFYINQDELKTKKKIMKIFNEVINKEKKIVIDNTNSTKIIRKEFIDICKENKYKITVLYFTTPIELCKHNSYFRNIVSNNNIKPIPEVVYRIYNKKFEEPNIKEGIDNIIKIDFTFENKKNKFEKYFKQFLY